MADVPGVASITADDLRSGTADGFVLTPYGETAGGKLWTGSGDGSQCIFVAQGDYVASSCNPVDVAAEHGVAIHALSADGSQSLQAVFSPEGDIASGDAATTGLTVLSEDVAINTSTPITGEITASSDLARGAKQGVVIPLLKGEG